MTTYDLLVEVPIAEVPSADGVRSEDPAFQRAVEDRLRQELERRQLQTTKLPAGNREQWLTIVEDRVNSFLAPAQLSLL